MLQVDEVKNIMSDNIEAVLSRGEKLDLLVDKTDNLMFEVSRGGDQSNHSCAVQCWCERPASQKASSAHHSQRAMLHCAAAELAIHTRSKLYPAGQC